MKRTTARSKQCSRRSKNGKKCLWTEVVTKKNAHIKHIKEIERTTFEAEAGPDHICAVRATCTTLKKVRSVIFKQ